MMAALLILIPTIGITFSMQAEFSDRAAVDKIARLLLAAIALFALLHPSEKLAMFACVPVLLFIGYWLLRRRRVLPSEDVTTVQPALASSRAGPNSAGLGR
jgi:hypothetical protein